MSKLPETPSQTAGPFVHIGLIPRQAGFTMAAADLGGVMLAPDTKGERIRIEGRIFDGAGAVVRDALVEIWQADAGGRFAHPADRRNAPPPDPHFRGWGRTGTDFTTGLWGFATIKPGRVGSAAPHASLWIVARGINTGLATRIYFADETAANAEDPVLRLVAPDRRGTLIAPRASRDGVPVYSFDIRLQGAGETVFFDA
ncbi:MAG TPA: protocatechuate 3,4-dioxygenase subunit alpha [Roseomonas sp.]|jgi:protocatechuate 3,4-dioxygenase alpha subunit